MRKKARVRKRERESTWVCECPAALVAENAHVQHVPVFSIIDVFVYVRESERAQERERTRTCANGVLLV